MQKLIQGFFKKREEQEYKMLKDGVFPVLHLQCVIEE